MGDFWADIAKDWVLLALAGLGVTFAPHDWVGGMFLGLAAAAFSMHVDPEQDRIELWVVLVGAFIVTNAAAIIASRMVPDVPVQLVMTATGLLSRNIARIILRMAGRVEDKSGVITDRIIDRAIPHHEKEDKP